MIVPRLTTAVIDELQPGDVVTERGQARATNGDHAVTGFGVRAHKTCTTYVLRLNGETHTLGRVELLALDEARRRARRKKAALLDGAKPPEEAAKNIELCDLLTAHEGSLEARVKAGDLKQTTLDGYRHLWEKHLLPRWSGWTLDQITPARIESWKAAAADTPVAWNRAFQQLHAAFALAVRMEWCQKNPCDAVKRFGETPGGRCLSDEEIAAWSGALEVLEERGEVSPEAAAALWALFYSGARPGEVLRARMEWMEQVPGLVRLQLPESKGDRPGSSPGRVVRVPWPASQALIELERSGSKWLIPGTGGGHLSYGALRYAFDKVCEVAGIEAATPKVLRHVWRSVAPEAGVNKEHVRQLGGWRSHRVPDSSYSHQRDEALDRGAAEIARKLKEVSCTG